MDAFTTLMEISLPASGISGLVAQAFKVAVPSSGKNMIEAKGLNMTQLFNSS